LLVYGRDAKTIVIGLLASTTHCRATAKGCTADNVIGIVIVVLLFGALVVGVLSWIWFRWGRGPFPAIMNLLAVDPLQRLRKK
jgi:hypothetical protein